MNGITLGDIAAVIALLLSGYAIWTTRKFNKRQLTLIESQEELNKRLLAQSDAKAFESRKADVGASYAKFGSSKYRLKVFNKGKAVARNVRIEFPDGDTPVLKSEIEDKFPMEVLEQHQSVDLIAAVSMGTPSKQTAIVRWSDDHSDSNEKTLYLTL